MDLLGGSESEPVLILLDKTRHDMNYTAMTDCLPLTMHALR